MKNLNLFLIIIFLFFSCKQQKAEVVLQQYSAQQTEKKHATRENIPHEEEIEEEPPRETTCEDIPEYKAFLTYDDMIDAIRDTEFALTDEFDTSRSNWITSAEYFSCDKIDGYMILGMRGKEYIFKDVPIEVWEEFKNAETLGGYYHAKIKGKYNL